MYRRIISSIMFCVSVLVLFTVSNSVTRETSNDVNVGVSSDMLSFAGKACNVAGVSASMLEVLNAPASIEKVETSMSSDTYVKKEVVDIDITVWASRVVDVYKSYESRTKRIGFFEYGDEITVTGKINNMYRVVYENKSGWIKKKYVSSSEVDKSEVRKGSSMIVSATAYYAHDHSASGRKLYSGHSLAGRICWLGRRVKLWIANKNGTKGCYMGEYRFDDTGYGQSTGYGSSRCFDGYSLGTIEVGDCIDIYVDSKQENDAWGRHNVYMEFID